MIPGITTLDYLLLRRYYLSGLGHMPFESEIGTESIRVRYFGVVTHSDVMELAGTAWGDPIWEKTKYYITDFLDAERLEMRPDQAIALALMNNASVRHGVRKRKYAFAVTNLQIIELINIYTETLETPNWDIRIFDNLDSAIEWATGE